MRCGARGATARDPVRAVDDGDDLDRGGRRRRAEAHVSGSSSISGATGRPAADLVARAQQAGYEALILTVDVPVAGPRLRDVRNGFSIPPKLKAKTALNALVSSGMVVQPAHHRAAQVRLAQLVERNYRRAY